MLAKKINRFYGYAFCALGIIRVIIVLIGFCLLGNSLSNFFKGSNVNISYDSFETICIIIGFAQILLAIFSIPMIFVNKKENPEVISGYLYGLGAPFISFFASGFTIFFEVSLYMKAGSKILEITSSYSKIQKREANTEWFYNQPNINNHYEEDNNNIINEIKKEKTNEKLLEEIYEWRKLLDAGEIDEEIYNEMKEKLLEKMKQ